MTTKYRMARTLIPVVALLMLMSLLAPARAQEATADTGETSAAQSSAGCPPGEPPRFVLGFAALAELLGPVMGAPLECEHANPDNGDALQQTTAGLAFWRASTNTPTFTDGWRHWALVEAGLVCWTGESIDPPSDPAAYNCTEPLVPVAETAPAPSPSPAPRLVPTVRPLPTARPIPTLAPSLGSGGGGGRGGCGSRGGPGYRLPSGKCASWRDAGRRSR